MQSAVWSCGANRSSHPHNDYRPGAKWRETIKNHKDSNPTDHLIMTVPGINGYTLAYDSLHILELGVSADIVANFMFDMVVKAELPGSSFEARLKELFRKLSGLYTELATDSSNQVRRLHLSTFCQPSKKWDSFPELSGVKAKQVRHIILHSWNSDRIWSMRALTKSTGLNASRTSTKCMKPWSARGCILMSQHMNNTRGARRIVYSITASLPRLQSLRTFFNGTLCTSTTWLAICQNNLGT